LDENYRPEVVQTSACVRIYPADGLLPSADAVKTASARTQGYIRVDMWHPRGHELCPRGCTHFSPPPSFASRPPSDAKKRYKKIKNYFILFYFIFFGGSCCHLELKREKKISVFNPQDPQAPRAPRAPRATRAKPGEEKGFFGLVP
jgi:hypothetical protein